MRWIKQCNRPRSQFNLGKIIRNTYVCTKDLSPDTSFDTETCESDESEKGLSGIQPDLPSDSLVETSAADENDSALSDSRKMYSIIIILLVLNNKTTQKVNIQTKCRENWKLSIT
ncbi:uncharacterized protein LOC144419930 [Styela clava]